MPERVTGLLLAAGRARRFGSNKMCARLPGGERVGVAAARALAAVTDACIVVVGADDPPTTATFRDAGFEVVACEDAWRGMAHSLRCGVESALDADAWLVALGDMPFISTGTLSDIVRTFRSTNAIVVPRFDGRPGHPVLFPARFGKDLRALHGDVGARAVVEAHDAQVQVLDVEDEGIVRDIDEPADLPRDGTLG